MKYIKFLTVPVLALSLTACIKAPTLEERLADKTGADREQELYYACIQRAHYKIPGGHDGDYIGHETRMWSICDAMHKINIEENQHATR